MDTYLVQLFVYSVLSMIIRVGVFVLLFFQFKKKFVSKKDNLFSSVSSEKRRGKESR